MRVSTHHSTHLLGLVRRWRETASAVQASPSSSAQGLAHWPRGACRRPSRNPTRHPPTSGPRGGSAGTGGVTGLSRHCALSHALCSAGDSRPCSVVSCDGRRRSAHVEAVVVWRFRGVGERLDLGKLVGAQDVEVYGPCRSHVDLRGQSFGEIGQHDLGREPSLERVEEAALHFGLARASVSLPAISEQDCARISVGLEQFRAPSRLWNWAAFAWAGLILSCRTVALF